MGRYLLLERLATGGMAEVYRARAQGAGGFEKQVAIKRILPSYSQNDEFRKMFEYEARLSSMLTHANIVQIFDFNKFAETYLLAMEYVDGKNLRQFVNKAKKLSLTYSVEFSVFVVNEVCKGLEYAHAKKDDMTGKPLNIIHRDMSPQNIMLSYEGAVKIVDFGIAKAKDRVDETRSGIIKGKFGYMSPEQANGMPVDHRTDLFSTGIILWEMLTGRRLFAAESDLATLRMIQECVVTPPSKINPRVPPELDRIVMKVLSKDLKLRYSSAGDLHRQLLEFLSKNAPAFTQREVSQTLQKAFAEEIHKEKRRYEQLNKQSIPFSQGAKRAEDDGMRDVADVIDGMQTKSDVVEQTGETFSEENDVESLKSPEISQISSPRKVSKSKVSDPTAISYSVSNFSPPDEDQGSGSSENDNPTRSQADFPENEDGKKQATVVGKPEEVPPSEAASEDVFEGAEIDPSNTGFRADTGTEPRTASSEPKAIDLQNNEEEVDLVLPGGGKHQFSRDTGTGARPTPPKTVLEDEEPPAPGKKWKGADIHPMGAGREGTGSTNVPTEPAEPSLSTSRPDHTPTQPSTASDIKVAPAPNIAPSRSAQKIDLLKAPAIEPIAPSPRRQGEIPWEQRAFRDNRVQPRPKKRVVHPIVPMLFLLAMTGYVYKLYVDGEVAKFIENNERTPTQVKPKALPPKRVSPEEPAKVDRKPVGDCTLDVRSTPPGAEVTENGTVRGLTPLVLSGPCQRSVNIVLKKEGFEYLSENVVISPKSSEWVRSLKAIPTGLLVLTLGFNAEMYVNGEQVRTARAQVPLQYPLRAKRTHKIRLVNAPYKIDFEIPVQVEDGQKQSVDLSLEDALAKSVAKRPKK